jgi:sigma-B regulation protein RsbU (phosphoserine phosphatase)
VNPFGPDFEDMVENAPCAYGTLHAIGRIEHVNLIFLAWSGHAATRWSGNASAIF